MRQAPAHVVDRDSKTSSVAVRSDHRTEQSQKYSPKLRNMFQMVQRIDCSGSWVAKPLAEAHFQISKFALHHYTGNRGLFLQHPGIVSRLLSAPGSECGTPDPA